VERLPIVHLIFPTQYLMTSSLLRFQEHYESPKFRGKIFGLEEYMDWYAATHGGTFSYFEDWVGFNFPSHILRMFEGDYSSKEEAVTLVVDGVMRKHGLDKCYVLGTAIGGEEAIDHEIAHALYSLYPEYARQVNRLCRTHAEALKPLEAWLKGTGYHKKVWNDEVNAYLLTGLSSVCELDIKTLPVKEFNSLLESAFEFQASQLSTRSWQNDHLYTVDMAPKLRRLRYK